MWELKDPLSFSLSTGKWELHALKNVLHVLRENCCLKVLLIKVANSNLLKYNAVPL